MLALFAALMAAGLSTPAHPTPTVPHGPGEVVKRPNIILITTDDQSVDDLRFMPFTRRLIGGQGATFTDAVAPYPLCCPARAMILTGMLSHNNGVLSNEEPSGGHAALEPLAHRTLPVWLQAAGYETTFVGKYLNGYGNSKDSSYDVPPGWSNWNGAVGSVYDYYGNTINQNGQLVDMQGTYQADITQAVTAQAIEEGAARRKPFFIWQSNLAPHGACWPREGAPCYWSKPMWHDADDNTFTDLRLPTLRRPNFNERVVADKPSHMQATSSWTGARIARMTRYHVARVRSLQAVDRNVRDTVQLLQSVGELDNTLIMFTSDNGYMLGEHRFTGKVLAYEPSLKVPFLMRGPGIPAGVKVDETAAVVDIAPTIADAAGATPLLVQDGRSLLPVANGEPGYDALAIEAGSVRGVPHGEWFYRGVRTGRYTYLHYPQSGEFELYDRQVDPHQLNNVAYRPTHRATRKALAEMLAKLRDCVGAACQSVGGPVPAPTREVAPVHPDELGRIGTARQVVTVTAGSWSSRQALGVAWQKRGRAWHVVRGPFPVQLGSRGLIGPGVARHLRGKTPAGVFGVAGAMGVLADPGTELAYRRLDRNDYWPFDPASPGTYNVFQPYRSAKASWAEALDLRWWDQRSRYRYAALMDYNLPRRVVRSAKFDQRVARLPADVRKGSFVLHVGDTVGKHGWISASQSQVRWLLRWMRPASQDTKFVVGTPTYLRSRL